MMRQHELSAESLILYTKCYEVERENNLPGASSRKQWKLAEEGTPDFFHCPAFV